MMKNTQLLWSGSQSPWVVRAPARRSLFLASLSRFARAVPARLRQDPRRQLTRPLKGHRGQALLLAIFVITLTLLAIAVGLGALGASQTVLGLNSRTSAQARTLAEAGVSDGLMKVVRTPDTNVPDPGYSLPQSTPDGTLKIVIEKDAPTTNQTTIRATAVVRSRYFTAEMIVFRGADGKITPVGKSWKRLTN